jgi:Beta-lactamase enzyme family
VSPIRLVHAVVVAAAVVLASASVAHARYAPQPWSVRKADAIDFVESRAGVESFAFVDEDGELRGYHPWRVTPSASVLKPMLLVAYLNLASVRDRALTDRDRALLAPMIRWSDNATAEAVLRTVGTAGLYRLARRADMHHFRVRLPVWGLSEITAADQARFFYRIDSFMPARHRTYARYLLSHIVPSQRWGIPPEVPAGWRIFFKGGWGSGTGRVTHQVALLQDGDRRIAVAVLTEHNPSHDYGTRTIRGVAARLLRVPLPGPTPSG